MKGPVMILGIALVVLGLIALAYQGITYTSHDTVLDIGPLHATADREHTLPLSPIIGIAALAGGIVLIVSGSRTRA